MAKRRKGGLDNKIRTHVIMASGFNFAVLRMLFCFFVLLARVLEDGKLECGIIEGTVSLEADICFYYRILGNFQG